MKKICVDARMLGFSGIGTYLANLIPIMQKSNHKWIYLVKKGMIKSYPFLKYGTLIETETPIYSKKELFCFHKEIPACDLYWAPHFNLPLFNIKAKKKVMTWCDTYHLTFMDSLNSKERLYSRWLLPRFVKRADGVITISNFSISEIIKHIPQIKNRLTKIYCGVDSDLFKEQKPSLEIDRKYNLPKNYFLSVGTHKKHKNLHGLLKGFSLFLKKNKATLVICGSEKGLLNSVSIAPLIEKDPLLKSHVLFLNNVPIEDLPYIYSRALCFVFPSFYEGFGLPPIEAMACGCPTIVSKIPSLSEVCGSASHFISPGNPVSIAQALEKVFLFSDFREDLRKKGEEHVTRYSWKTAAIEHLNLFDNLLRDSN
jgi:glycosyltransferase involved in cell wall biosynthesis